MNRQSLEALVVSMVVLALLLSTSTRSANAASFSPPGVGPVISRTAPRALGIGVSGGGSHSCALTPGGGVVCWGDNEYGQLGDGTTTRKLTPVSVSGLSAGVMAVEAGNSYTCALTTGGGVKCWGDNSKGQLGDGTMTRRLTPVDVFGLAGGVSAVSAGGGQTCAVTTTGGLKCWGDNSNGQLGDGTITQRLTPVDVSGLTSGVSAVAAGFLWHTCALTTGGGVKCWGRGDMGKLGNGSNAEQHTPVDVTGLTSGVSAIAIGGWHTCALTSNGGVKCWGQSNTGAPNSNVPVDVNGLTSGIVAITAGNLHTCALTTDGGSKCWGQNSEGQLGDGSVLASPLGKDPGDVVGLGNSVTAFSAGSLHSCAVLANQSVRCWGSNAYGQLGDGAALTSLRPVDVIGMTTGVSTISAGGSNTCASTGNGGARCWGANDKGQLGNSTTSVWYGRNPIPIDVTGLPTGVQKTLSAGSHSCALTAGAGVLCWGSNGGGQLGDGTTTDRSSPVAVVGLAGGVNDIASVGGHTCALMNTGGVKCWGVNNRGELGDGTTTTRPSPVDVTGLSSNVIAIAGGGSHTCALMSGGTVKCWGDNTYGQLGNGTPMYTTAPTDVPGLTAVIGIAAGTSHTCVVTSGGGTQCWGRNFDGQLGDGSTTDRYSPVGVSGLTNGVSAVTGGTSHTCALMTGGSVKCWGSNMSGQLGDGTRTNRLTPVAVIGLSGIVSMLDAGASHTCAVTGGGGAQCWGSNSYGQLGDGTLRYYVPGLVIGIDGFLIRLHLPFIMR